MYDSNSITRKIDSIISRYNTRDMMEAFDCVMELRENFGFSVPRNRKTMETIANWIGKREVLSIGSGRACMESILKGLGVNIVCTDEVNIKDSFMDVETISSKDASKKYKEREILFIGWADYEKSHTAEAVISMKPKYIIYVGEWQGGCCADDQFFEILEEEYTELDKDEIVEEDVSFGTVLLNGINDGILFFERDPEEE